MNIKYLFLLFVIMMFVINELHANTLIVDIKGTGNYTSIQEGIDNSSNGDTVLVYSGTYYENINYNGKNITLASLYLTTQADSFIHQTIIDGSQNGSVVTFESGEDTTAVLCGFTIKHGSGTYYHTLISGGGIFIKNSQSKMLDCIIKNNIADLGAGIYIDNGQTNLRNVTVTDNHAYVYGGGIILTDSNIKFNNSSRCSIYNNYAGVGCDMYLYNTPDISVYVDTFTVLEPNSHFVYNRGPGIITFDIQHNKIIPIDHDLYVSTDGDNSNSGISPYAPLRNIYYALNLIAPDSLDPKTIYVSNGLYSHSSTGEKFALNCREYVSIIGEKEETTIFDGEELSSILEVYKDKDLSVKNVTILNGKARFGGGMNINDNSNPMFLNVSCKDNLVTNFGGGIYCGSNSNPIFDNVSIINNTAKIGGGCFFCENARPIFINCKISENNAVDPELGAHGGIISQSGANFVMINTELTENYAEVDISGFSNLRGTGENSHSYIINCTVSNNYPTPRCNILADGAHLTIINSIFRNNSEDEIKFSSSQSPDTVIISYSNIKDSINGINTNNNGTIIWGDGNIDEEPIFVGGDPFSYELTKYSPCIDAGTPDTTGLNLPATDLAGNQRIYNGRIDIGAYEYQGYGIDQPDTSFIHSLYLFQNTPNPFNNETEILFITADYERVENYTLSIYNTKGQLVRRYDGKTNDFWVKTKIVWDGTDEYGRQVAPGTYLYKLEYNGNAVVRKMIRIR